MKSFHAALAMLCVATLSPCAFAGAAPLVVEESAKIEIPNPLYQDIRDVAIYNDKAVITSGHGGDEGEWAGAWLFERQSNGQWIYTTTLYDAPSSTDRPLGPKIAMNDNIITLSRTTEGHTFVLEKKNGSWVPTQNFEVAFDGGDDTAIDGDFVASSGAATAGHYGAFTFLRRPDGTWLIGEAVSALETSPNFVDETDFLGGKIAFASRALVVGSPDPSDDPAVDLPGQALVFLGTGVDWLLARALTAPAGFESPAFGDLVAGNAHAVYVSDRARTYVYRTEPTFAFDFDHRVEPASFVGTTSIDASGRLLAVGLPGESVRAPNSGSIQIFRLPDQGPSRVVAHLEPSDANTNASVGFTTAIGPVFSRGGGYQVIASRPNLLSVPNRRTAYIFELKNLDNEANTITPDPVNDDFETGNAGRWSALPGSRFTLNTNNGSRVYRQTDVVGTAGSLITSMDWKDQAIEADIKPQAFDGADRWAGVVVDYTDENNFYYVAIRSTNVAQLNVKRNGVSTTLASIAVPVVINRTYQVRLEKLGTWVRAFVNGAPIGMLRETTHTHGKAGLMMFKTKADFDNVLVTPTQYIAMVASNFEANFADRLFAPTGTTAWSIAMDGTRVFKQASTAGNARALTGFPSSTDQSVQTRVKVLKFNGSDTWVGLIVDYQDDHNYTYLTLRSNQSIGLRKLVNGTIFHIDDAPLKVNTGAWYTLRLEAIGGRVRGYVNNSLMVEGPAPSPQSGRYGLAMYKTAAEFDDFLAVQP